MAYLTPDNAGTPIVKTIIVPVLFLPAVSGALLELARLYNWEKRGLLTQQECVDTVQVMIDNYWLP